MTSLDIFLYFFIAWIILVTAGVVFVLWVFYYSGNQAHKEFLKRRDKLEEEVKERMNHYGHRPR